MEEQGQNTTIEFVETLKANMQVVRYLAYEKEIKGGLDHLLPKFEHIFVAAITFPPFLLCRYF